MSGLFPTVVTESDLRTLKARINPQITLIDGIVQRTTASLDEKSRGDWREFAAQWRAFFVSDGLLTSSQVDVGQALERRLRDLKSVLSSQCYGVPSPAPKRAVSFFPTWVTSNLVREQKSRIAPRMREIGMKVVPELEEGVRRAWGEFARAWAEFESDAEAETHATAQYENALAFEDVLPEWDDAIAMASGSVPQTTPLPFPASPLGNEPPRPRGVAPGLPSPDAALATVPKEGMGVAIAVGAAVLVASVLLLKGSHP